MVKGQTNKDRQMYPTARVPAYGKDLSLSLQQPYIKFWRVLNLLTWKGYSGMRGRSRMVPKKHMAGLEFKKVKLGITRELERRTSLLSTKLVGLLPPEN